MRYIVVWQHPSGAGRGGYVECEAPTPASAARHARKVMMGAAWGGTLTVREVGNPDAEPARYRVERTRLRRLTD